MSRVGGVFPELKMRIFLGSVVPPHTSNFRLGVHICGRHLPLRCVCVCVCVCVREREREKRGVWVWRGDILRRAPPRKITCKVKKVNTTILSVVESSYKLARIRLIG